MGDRVGQRLGNYRVIRLLGRRKSIISVAVFAGASLLLVCSVLLILNLWYPNILQDPYANASSLSAVFPALSFGVPLLTSDIMVGPCRMTIAICMRTCRA